MDITQLIILYFVAINIVAFVMYGIDKWKAKHAKWRIPEATLIYIAAFGGSIGALIGMEVWHHKTMHKKFKYGVPAILVIQILILGALLTTSCTAQPKQDNSQTKATEEEIEEPEILEDIEFDEIADITYTSEGSDSDFVILSDIVPDIIQEIRYFSTYNFIGRRIPGYDEPIAIITRKAANALRCVSDELVAKGFRLKVFDAYRPMTAVRYFVQWAKNPADTLTKQYFYPNVNKANVFQLGYISSRSAHARGATIDLTLFDMQAEREVDMGGTFDFFGEISHPSYRTGLSDQQIAMRMLLRETMMKYGFKPVSTEWWHFTLRNEPYPDTSFDFPVNSNSIK